MKAFPIVLQILISQTCIAQFTITRLDNNSIPKSAYYSGHIVEAVRWTDSQGDNLVITTETGMAPGKGKDNDGFVDAALVCLSLFMS